jgi:hypothetical protein
MYYDAGWFLSWLGFPYAKILPNPSFSRYSDQFLYREPASAFTLSTASARNLPTPRTAPRQECAAAK